MRKLRDASSDLRSELVSLKTQWLATRQAWRDPVGDRFEKEFWRPLEQESYDYLRALQNMAEILQQADFHTR